MWAAGKRTVDTARVSGLRWTATLAADRVLPIGVLGLWPEIAVTPELLARQLRAIFAAWGMSDAHIRVTVEHVLYADRHGIDSHGCGMLKAYDVGLRAGWLTATPTIEIVRETDATALLDGGGGIGHAAADAAMRLAIEKARATGVASVAVRNSGHFGAAGSYARLATDAGMIGLATTNTREPAVVPAFGADAILGTNPIALAAPAARNPPFLLDMATSTAALGKLVVAWRKGKRIPRGWAVDQGGRPVRSGRDAALGRRLTPLGATPQMGSHKGYGLATAVEILSAVLPGGGVGHFFLAIDPERFRDAGEFETGVDALLDALRASRPADPATPVRVAGDPERTIAAQRDQAGIPLARAVVEDLRAVAHAADAAWVLDA